MILVERVASAVIGPKLGLAIICVKNTAHVKVSLLVVAKMAGESLCVVLDSLRRVKNVMLLLRERLYQLLGD